MTGLIEELQRLFPGLQGEEGGDMPALVVPADQLLAVMKELKERQGFNFLADITAVDYKNDEQIEMVYHLLAVPEARELRVKVNLNRRHPEVPSLTAIWPAADVQEREVYDLMGVAFPGHPNLKRILCPDDFTGHPLRKDFRLKAEEGRE
ncbi:NAD(P)H-quinone oxidoreductase subunit J, chloroplastic [Neomoorella glycerini]|uniref:NADH-quinone oxidoreductase subunit C n=1 Tax=Neomoorella glycerini TaxID=55779 RepID=A0A6I5ZUK3_9FIRM|nr:NADH-quinone oxidoreductase subunit C [Moorella glycerini]QGP93061.1 NAD(P)H-quinone oxidoreductase subunit J, chloroplastic [Moorella glycerini]